MKHDDFVRAVVIPLASSLITGILTALGALAVCALAGQPLYYALAAGSLAGLGAWLVYRGHWWAIVENVLLPDRVEPEKLQETTRVLITGEDGHQGDYLDLPCTEAQLISLAAGLMNGNSFSLDSWTGAGRPFSRSRFEALR
jgi:hypothetical protein